MIECVSCEITRSKIKAAAMDLIGRTPNHIAVFLSFENNAEYYIEKGVLYRSNKVAPYEPYLIKVFNKVVDE